MNTGDHVVCVNGRFNIGLRTLYDQFPKQDQAYVIRDVRLGINPDCKTGDLSVLLVGIVNPKSDSKSNLERGFSSSRFMPLEEFKAIASTAEGLSCPSEMEKEAA